MLSSGGIVTIARRILATTAAALCVAAVSVVSGAPAASADPGNTDPGSTGTTTVDGIPADVKARMAAERPYSAAAKQIQLTIVTSGAAGFAGIGINPRGVDLWWKGAVPANVRAAIDKARATVRVDVTPARFSRADLEAAAAPLLAAMRADPATTLHSIRLPADGSRVIAVFDSDAAVAGATGRTSFRTSDTATGQTVGVRSDVPLEITRGDRASTAHRWNDGQSTGVFSGGAAMLNNDNGHDCTTGFGVTNGSWRFILTAAHCGRVGGIQSNGNWTRQIGTAFNEHTSFDIMLIPTAVDHYIWDGGANSNMFVKSTIGWDWARVGETVCFSGITSGAQCNIFNTANFTYAYCSDDTYGNF
jgi:streptogrisin D